MMVLIIRASEDNISTIGDNGYAINPVVIVPFRFIFINATPSNPKKKVAVKIIISVSTSKVPDITIKQLHTIE